MQIKILTKFQFLLKQKARFKVMYGGRGGGKSENIARALLVLALNPQNLFNKKSIRILCAREYQTSIGDSVHKLFSDIINQYELHSYFNITKASIKTINGSEFIFKGISNDPLQIKSTSGVDICWVEEAEKVSRESWDFLTPTIRNEGGEIWVSFNPNDRDDPTYKMFVENPLPNTIAVKINYYDNPYFDKSPIKDEMLYDKKYNYDLYLHKWEGEIKKISDSLIFKNKFVVQEFSETSDHYYFGADWGFSKDPTAIIRCFVKDNNLYIDYEAGGVGIEYEELAELFQSIPESNKWNIYGDSQQPATISYLQKRGFNIYPCKKRAGSVEDGITLLKSFKQIIIHPRCREVAKEFGTYSYKTDINGNPLPIILDAYNHYIDALRYSLDGYHKRSFTIACA
jgi:phage terminase large subunit